jgi:ketosteroid isomerase-like protein
LRREVLAWLDQFAAAVRAVDYEAGEALFAPEVVGFGTVGALLVGRDALVERQWRRVWGVTSGFRFDLDRATCGFTDVMAWAAAPWVSRGTRAGQPFDRRGRATYVLRRGDGGRWLAVHSHHSLDPAPADAP